MTKVEDLITINDGYRGDRTLKQFDQYIRIDLVNDNPPKCQLVFDRRHIEDKSKSKPVAYITYSNINDLVQLATNIYAAAFAIVNDGLPDVPEDKVRSIFDMQTPVVRQIARQYLVELNKRRLLDRLRREEREKSEDL